METSEALPLVATAPIPAAAWMFGSALSDLTGPVRRRKR